jgi:hypothetical protein
MQVYGVLSMIILSVISLRGKMADLLSAANLIILLQEAVPGTVGTICMGHRSFGHMIIITILLIIIVIGGIAGAITRQYGIRQKILRSSLLTLMAEENGAL